MAVESIVPSPTKGSWGMGRQTSGRSWRRKSQKSTGSDGYAMRLVQGRPYLSLKREISGKKSGPQPGVGRRMPDKQGPKEQWLVVRRGWPASLPAKNKALSHQTTSMMKNQTTAKCGWVPVQDADAGASVQELPALEAAPENPVGGGSERDWNGEGPTEDLGLVCG